MDLCEQLEIMAGPSSVAESTESAESQLFNLVMCMLKILPESRPSTGECKDMAFGVYQQFLKEPSEPAPAQAQPSPVVSLDSE